MTNPPASAHEHASPAPSGQATSGHALPHRAALHVAAAVSTYDRFVVVPLLVLLALAFDASVAELMVLAVGHQVAYGLGQPLWGALSDRFGRVRIIRLALWGGALSAVASALAPQVAFLLVARVLAGGLFGAVVPTIMAFIADKAPAAQRRNELSALMRSIAVGTASATAISGVVGQFVGWRAAFLVPALLALMALWGLRGATAPKNRKVVSLREAAPGLARREVLLVLGLVLVEGALILGALQLLPTALQDAGRSAGLSGIVVALFGVGVVLAAGVLQKVPAHVPLSRTAAVGSLGLLAALGAVAVEVNLWTVAASSLGLAVAWAFLHNALQTWISSIDVPGRGLVVSTFAGCLFVGSALGAWAASPAVEAGEWRTLFGVAAAMALVLGLVAVGTRLARERH